MHTTLIWSPAIALGGTGQVGVAWAACWASCNGSDSTIRADLAWAESADNGASWFRSRVVADASSSSARRVNDWPSVVWPDTGRRFVLYNAWTPGTNAYRLYVRMGTGLP